MRPALRLFIPVVLSSNSVLAIAPIPNPCFQSVSISCQEYGLKIEGELEYHQIPRILEAAQMPEGEIPYQILVQDQTQVLLVTGSGSAGDSGFVSGHEIFLELKNGQWHIVAKLDWIT